MIVAEEDLTEMILEIWSSTLGLEVAPGSESIPNGEDLFVTACVQLTGEWCGAVSLQCKDVFARLIAAAMFGMGEDEVGTDEVNDAMGEMANIAAGAFKSIIGSGQLSLPMVTTGHDYKVSVPGTVERQRVAFDCEQHSFVVKICELTDTVDRSGPQGRPNIEVKTDTLRRPASTSEMDGLCKPIMRAT